MSKRCVNMERTHSFSALHKRCQDKDCTPDRLMARPLLHASLQNQYHFGAFLSLQKGLQQSSICVCISGTGGATLLIKLIVAAPEWIILYQRVTVAGEQHHSDLYNPLPATGVCFLQVTL